jgi:hypothetical protein
VQREHPRNVRELLLCHVVDQFGGQRVVHFELIKGIHVRPRDYCIGTLNVSWQVVHTSGM